jgi:hypothetical protein
MGAVVGAGVGAHALGELALGEARAIRGVSGASGGDRTLLVGADLRHALLLAREGP